jgi:hypothetical protein
MSLVSVLGCGTWSFPIEEQLYYLLHMALCEGRVDALVDAWEQRGYEVQIAETLLRYTFGPSRRISRSSGWRTIVRQGVPPPPPCI